MVQMKAAIFTEHGGPEVLEVTQVARPDPGPGEVRVRVRAAAMNHLDLWVRRGLPIEITMPHIGGSDLAGEVDAVGPGVDFGLGTRVVADPSLGYGWYDRKAGEPRPDEAFRLIGEHTQGGFAEFAIVPTQNLLVLPDAIDFETAAAAGLVSVTAWHALVARARLQSAETLLVTGASGGVATMAIQIGRHLGATVFAVTSGPDNVERARALGAHVVYDRLSVDFASEVWSATDQRGVDVVLDSVGEDIWPSLVRSLATYGRLVTYGGTTGHRARLNIPQLFWKQLNLMGSTMGTPAEYREVMQLVFDAVLTPPIHTVLPLERIREAHEVLEAGGVFGKIVITP